MDENVVLLAFAGAVLHPFRDLLLKGSTSIGAGYFVVMLIWLAIAVTQIIFQGHDISDVLPVWHVVLLSAIGITTYYIGILTAMKAGDLSIYYPIIRSAPVFMVFAGWLVLGETYGPVVLIGVALVTLGVWLLQHQPGSSLLHSPALLAVSLLAMAGMGTQSLADAHAMQQIEAPVLLFWEFAFALVFCAGYLLLRRPAGAGPFATLFQGWKDNLWRFATAGATGYLSYYLILTAYQHGGDAVAVNCIRQISIPLSVLLGGLILRELNMGNRFAWSLLIAFGIVVIILTK